MQCVLNLKLFYVLLNRSHEVSHDTIKYARVKIREVSPNPLAKK